ncbi:MAG: phosphate signaling complex protein PhoU [Sedimentisphaerales bacterium]
MPKQLQKEIEIIKNRILNLSNQVKASVHDATIAIEQRDGKLARKVIENDTVIDREEIEIEEECLKTLALHQPVAIDLRFIIAMLKINNDLERIGDLAVNVAERAAFLATQPKPDMSFDFVGMANAAQSMLTKSLDAFVNLNIKLAKEVSTSDDTIDAMNRQMYIKVQQAILAHPEQMESLINMLSVSRYLERIADHATNIAEDVIYMIEGQIVRHRTEDYK